MAIIYGSTKQGCMKTVQILWIFRKFEKDEDNIRNEKLITYNSIHRLHRFIQIKNLRKSCSSVSSAC
jgi:hypothetical protein